VSQRCHERKSYPKASVLIEVRHKLVRQYRPIAINDAKVGRIVLTVVDPSLGSQQCVCGSLCAKGLSSLDYLAGRIHFDNEYRQVGDHGFISLANPLRNAYQRLRSKKNTGTAPLERRAGCRLLWIVNLAAERAVFVLSRVSDMALSAITAPTLGIHR